MEKQSTRGAMIVLTVIVALPLLYILCAVFIPLYFPMLGANASRDIEDVLAASNVMAALNCRRAQPSFTT